MAVFIVTMLVALALTLLYRAAAYSAWLVPGALANSGRCALRHENSLVSDSLVVLKA